MQLTVLHTNDIHGHLESWLGWDGELAGRTVGGFDRLATAVATVRNHSQNVLLLDAGDAIGDTLLASSTKGKAVVELMNAVGYDAMTLGNHEPDYGMDVLRQRISEAHFDVVASNVLENRSKQPFTRPYTTRTFTGLQVAILGLAYPNTPLTTAQKNIAGYEFRPAQQTAAEYVPKLRRAGAGLVIVLSHLGLNADLALARSVPGIDIIVGGHSHNRMKELVRVGQTIIVQAGAHLTDLGRLDLEVENGTVTNARSELITLDNGIVASDASVARKIALYHSQRVGRQVAVAGGPIVRAQTLAGTEPRKRDEESPADSLFADTIRQYAGADVAFLPGVGYGVAIPAGPVSREALRNLIPHQSRLIVMTLTGADLTDILEQSLENVLSPDPGRKVGGMIQVSGISFTYRSGHGFRSRVQRVLVDGRPLIPQHLYRVVTNSMLAEGGHNYATFTRGTDRRQLGPQYDIVERALQRLGRIRTPELGRIAKED